MILKSKATKCLLCLTAMGVTSAPAHALTTTFTNRASWEAAVAGEIVTETFDSIQPQTLPATGATNLGPFVVETVGSSGVGVVNESNANSLNGTRFFATHADASPEISTSFVFSSPIKAFGFDFRTSQPGDGTQLTFADVELLDLRDGLKLTSGFIGFIASQSFSRIDFVSKQPSFSRTFLDNLSTVAASSGDFNGDSVVDGLDFLEWQRGNSPVSLSPSDLNEWKANFGQSVAAELQAAPAAVAVPEPSTMALLFLAGAYGLRTARQRS